MTQVSLVIILAIGLGLFAQRVGAVVTILATFIVALAALPVVVTTTIRTPHVGVAGPGLDISTYGTAVCLGLLIVLVCGQPWSAFSAFIPLLVFLAVGMASLWTGTNEQWAGLSQYVLGVGGWIIGDFVARHIALDGRAARALITILALVVALQFSLGILQWLGIISAAVDTQTAELVSGRVSGSLNHPNNLGKTLFLVMALLLPFTKSSDRMVRRMSHLGLSGALVTIALTGGRAVIVAAILLLAVWSFLQPAVLSLGSRFVLPGVAAVAVLLFGGAAYSRLEEDPEGGARNHLLDVALRQIPVHPWAGVGPNSYVTAVGPYDALTATGWPVHNSFVLALVELGGVGMACLFVPVAWALWRTVPMLRSSLPSASFAAAALASILGTVVIATTGWSMVAGPILPLWFFTVSFLTRAAAAGRTGPERLGQIRAADNRLVAGNLTFNKSKSRESRDHARN